VSIINKMLQELDRRHAGAAPHGQVPHPEVHAVTAPHSRHEWFWRLIAALFLFAAAWTGWVVYQLQPRVIATELARQAFETTRRNAPSVPPAPVATPAPVVAQAPIVAEAAVVPAPTASTAAPVATPPPAEAVSAAPAPETPVTPFETLRLALSIDTPLAPRVRAPALPKPAKSASTARASAPEVLAARPHGSGPASVEKRDRSRAPLDRAEADYRRAAGLLNSGRIADAEDALLSALDADSAHQAARQTLIALYIEQRRFEDARRHLQEGLAGNPSYAPFAVALARIHVDRREYAMALGVLDRALPGARGNRDFYELRGAVLQRLSRHGEAADAYRQALASGVQNGASWVGLGISLEALDRRPEAAEAYRRGIATGSLNADLFAYAEQRAQQLR
jgi:MSHA biogenesis protein MshN